MIKLARQSLLPSSKRVRPRPLRAIQTSTSAFTKVLLGARRRRSGGSVYGEYDAKHGQPSRKVAKDRGRTGWVTRAVSSTPRDTLPG